MKRFCTLPAGVIFLLTAGLPILAFIILLAVEIVLDVNQGSSNRKVSESTSMIIAATWLLGFIFLQLWGLRTADQFRKKSTDRLLFNRATMVFGLLGLVVLFVLCHAFIEAIRTPTIKASESIEGFDSIGSLYRSPWVMPTILLSAWFFPRLLFFGFLSRALTRQERRSNWFPTMILFLLWPIGIWFLQPRIRAVLMDKKSLTAADHLVG